MPKYHIVFSIFIIFARLCLVCTFFSVFLLFLSFTGTICILFYSWSPSTHDDRDDLQICLSIWLAALRLSLAAFALSTFLNFSLSLSRFLFGISVRSRFTWGAKTISFSHKRYNKAEQEFRKRKTRNAPRNVNEKTKAKARESEREREQPQRGRERDNKRTNQVQAMIINCSVHFSSHLCVCDFDFVRYK